MSLSPEMTATLTAFAGTLADAARAAILPYFRTAMAVDDKGEQWGGAKGYDPVTEGDRAGEAAIRALIEAHYPDHGILGEEFGAKKGASPFTWVLDPIDGTRAFITGLPLWGTLIGLNDGTRPVVGVMDQGFTGERFTGSAAGSFLNGKPIRTRPCPGLSAARLMATGPYLFRTPETKAAFERVAAKAQLLRYGGDCYAYCMVAAGHVDAVVESSLETYDIQALIPIIEGAGGVVTSWDGGDPQAGGNVVAAGDKRVHAEVLGLLAG